MDVVRAVAFAAGTVVLVAISRRSLLRVRSHGFFRFFAFEAILCLVVLHAPRWFARPLAPNQIASWALLTISAALAIHGFHLLRLLGKATAPVASSSLYGFENTTTLVTAGAYRYIRHPMYSSLLFLAWGAAFKSPSLVSVAVGLAATVLLIFTAKAEEAENLARFGDLYRDYVTRTWRFIPFVI